MIGVFVVASLVGLLSGLGAVVAGKSALVALASACLSGSGVVGAAILISELLRAIRLRRHGASR